MKLKHLPKDDNLTPFEIAAAITAVEARKTGGTGRDQETMLQEVLQQIAPAVSPEEVRAEAYSLRASGAKSRRRARRLRGAFAVVIAVVIVAGSIISYKVGNELYVRGWTRERLSPAASKIGPVEIYNTPDALGLGPNPVQISVRLTPNSAFSPFSSHPYERPRSQSWERFNFSSIQTDEHTWEKW